ncbi:uncharacterized protein ACA1_184410 [Acanthamoeba castellanii str. Neff]|uniref:Uncharacterized protein n=1 Tax=Acanthamoeba castellanii (strain ATCC 30010 / Neff) TaxID=1257118 RepID=L8H7I7_ACACF|nr:uncharacterized protein ACA1_184410 [Acanthamoeba castellanii str. Neff]ELR21494.1 hypothetical protein ACA1_184410 [Acanthamoeba castellanii str. Neff]
MSAPGGEEDFSSVKDRWTRRAARNPSAPPPQPGQPKSGTKPTKSTSATVAWSRLNQGANGDLMLKLPIELLILICCTPAIKARDLVALELACSRFRTGAAPSPTEQAARMKLAARHPRLEPALYDEAAPLPLASNFKGLLYHMDECQWRVGGFRCQGRRPPAPVRGWEANVDDRNDIEPDLPPVPVPTGCGHYLMWDPKQGRLRCPAGCGSLVAPTCACKAYMRDEEEEKKLGDHGSRYSVMTYAGPAPSPLRDSLAQLAAKSKGSFTGDDVPEWWWDQPLRCKTPAMTCIACGFTVAEHACLGRPTNSHHLPFHPPRALLQEGFYERVWCSYRWQCYGEGGCSVIHGGPERRDGQGRPADPRFRALLCCVSGDECRSSSDSKPQPGREGTEMATLEWLDTFGPPTNYYDYRAVKLPAGPIDG